MGVTDLWSVLYPVKEHLPLNSLRGQRLAVDLSIWICESQGTRQMEGIITKPFLRNLFFRVSHLLQLGIDLIFIIDGRAPEIKAETMHKRQNGRFLCGKSLRTNFRPCKSTNRSNLNAAVKQCCELLEYLGVPYLQSQGEAEAYCAFLNKNGVVDACITNDGDAFLYGAKKVYRNFTMDRKDPHVESYTMQDIKHQLFLNQEKLVAFALLTGCDYQPKGVPHVGVETALKLLMAITDKDVLLRFRQWRSMKPSDCCCAIEKSVWEKACRLPGFPSEQIIEEFLVSKDILPKKNLEWKSPRMKKFENFMVVKLEWPKDYAVQKVLPLLTRWIMLEVVGVVTTKTRGLHLTPVKILKNRVCKGVQSVEVEWNISGSSEDEAYVTIEDKEMVSQCFPDLLEQFSQELNKNTKTKAVFRIKSKKEKTRQKENSAALDQEVLLLSLKGLNLCSNKQGVQKSVEGAGERPLVKMEASTGTFACEQIHTVSFNDEPIRNCLSSACHLQSQQPSSDANVTNLKCIDMDSTDLNISEDEYLPLKERLKNFNVQTQNHRPKKEMSKVLSLLPSFINSNKPETNSEIAKPLELCSERGNQILNCVGVSACSSDQQTNAISDGTGISELINLTGNSCLELNSSNDEDSDDSLYLPVSHKLINRYQISNEFENEGGFHSSQCLPLNLSQAPCDNSIKPNHWERLEVSNRTEFSGNLSEMFAEHFGNSQLLSKTDEIAEEFFMLNGNNEVDASSSDYSGISSIAAPQLCTDVIEGSFSTDATKLCSDVVEESFSTKLCTDVIEGSFSTDATQLCTDVIEGSPLTTDTTLLCRDIVKGFSQIDATQLCTNTLEVPSEIDATQPLTENQSIHLLNKDRSSSTKDTKFSSARDLFLQNTQYLSNGQCSSFSPNLKTSSKEALQNGNCNNTISNYYINREENVSLHFINSISVNNDTSFISNHSQTQENISVMIMNNKKSIIEKTKPMSSNSITNKLSSSLDSKDIEPIVIEDDDAIDFVINNTSSADQTFKNSSLLSNDCLNQTKIETVSQHILYSDLDNLSESLSDMALHRNSGVNTTTEFRVPKTPEDASFVHELTAFNRDPEKNLLLYSSFEEHSSIMDAVYNLTPDSLHSFSESRVGNFELLSSLLDNSSDSAKTSKDVLKTSLFNTRINSGYKSQMEIKYPCGKNSLTNLNKNSCFTLSPYTNSRETSTPLESPNNSIHFSYNKTVSSNEVSADLHSSSSPVLSEDLNTGLNNKLFYKFPKESTGLDNEETKFECHYEGNISSSSCENIPNCPSQTPLQQGDSLIYEGTNYLSCFSPPFDVTNTVTPKLSNQNNPGKCWDYLNLSLNSVDNSVNLSNDTFDDYKSSVKMKTDVGLKDNCNVDDSKLESKPNSESPLPLIMRLGKHFNAQHMNLKK